jgi:hypothetical protein
LCLKLLDEVVYAIAKCSRREKLLNLDAQNLGEIKKRFVVNI